MTSTERATVALEEWQKQEVEWGEWKRDLRSLLTLLELWQNILKFCISKKTLLFSSKVFLLLYVADLHLCVHHHWDKQSRHTLWPLQSGANSLPCKHQTRGFSVVVKALMMAVTTSLAPASLTPPGAYAVIVSLILLNSNLFLIWYFLSLFWFFSDIICIALKHWATIFNMV